MLTRHDGDTLVLGPHLAAGQQPRRDHQAHHVTAGRLAERARSRRTLHDPVTGLPHAVLLRG